MNVAADGPDRWSGAVPTRRRVEGRWKKREKRSISSDSECFAKRHGVCRGGNLNVLPCGLALASIVPKAGLYTDGCMETKDDFLGQDVKDSGSGREYLDERRIAASNLHGYERHCKENKMKGGFEPR